MCKNTEIGDIVLSITVVIQFFLIILQQCMIGIFHIDPDQTTIYRVILSAIPVIISLYYIFRRESFFALSVLLSTVVIMLLHSVVFPETSEYIWTQGTRFLLPICVPTMLAMRAVNSFELFEKVVTIISWVSIILLFIYTICFLLGIVVLDNYNMSFGYGLLLPTLVLYRQKNIISKIVFLFALISILAIGSRGPILVIVLYILFDVFLFNKKYIPVFFILVLSLGSIIVPLMDYLDTLGINSRTLAMLYSGDITQDSGRGYLSNIIIEGIVKNPILGMGIYSDRVLLDGIQPYCHNLFLELFINWGIPLACIIILVLFVSSLNVFVKITDRSQKTLFIIFLLSSIIPLMLSSSYLIDSKLWIYVGLLLFYHKKFSIY